MYPGSECVKIKPRVRRRTYVGVLVGCDRDELRLGEGKSLDSAGLAAVLRPVLVHLHHMEPGLVLVQGLQHHHLHGARRHFTASDANFGRRSWTHAAPSEYIPYKAARGLLLIVSFAMHFNVMGFTCPVLLDAPLLFVSFSFPNDISCRIQCAPVLGESGCM